MMRCESLYRYSAAFVTGVLLLASVSAFAANALAEWKTECVGRYQLGLPGEVELALTHLPTFIEANPENPHRFADMTPAPYTKGFAVSHVASRSDFEKFKADFSARRLQTKKRLLADSKLEIAKTIQPLTLNIAESFGWRGAEYATIYVYRNSHVFRFYNDDAGVESFVAGIESAFHPRPLYDVPKGEGICIPYGFIADEDKPGRQIGVTMRLIGHPDVEIFFEDQTAPRPYKTGAKLADSERLNYIFWELEARKTNGIEVLFPGYRSIELGGYPGTASFVEIKRKDGTIDYGYAATVAGDYTATADTPRLTLYVIRTASRAKGTPVGKSELKDMAYKIAASVKRREVK